MACELKFEPNLGWRAKFLRNFSCRSQNINFCWKLWSKELNDTVTGGLKNDRRGMKRGSWPPDIPAPPFNVSALPGDTHMTVLFLFPHCSLPPVDHVMSLQCIVTPIWLSFLFLLDVLPGADGVLPFTVPRNQQPRTIWDCAIYCQDGRYC